MDYFKLIPILIFTSYCYSQSEENYYNIIDSVSEYRIENDIKKTSFIWDKAYIK
jgi:hypothetical protein